MNKRVAQGRDLFADRFQSQRKSEAGVEEGETFLFLFFVSFFSLACFGCEYLNMAGALMIKPWVADVCVCMARERKQPCHVHC